jgi:PAS domain S-box-containing protein
MTGEAGVTVVEIIGSAPRGSHLSVFHETKEDLLDVLIPYFKTGLEKGEFCLWITSDAVTEEEAESVMRKRIAEFDLYLSEQRIEIVSGQKWVPKRESSARRTVIEACQARLDHALARGLAGMRASWGLWPVDKRKRRAYLQYEERITQWLRLRKVLMICGYPVAECGAGDLLDLTAVHDCAVSVRQGNACILKPLQRGRHDRLNEARLDEQVAARTKELTTFIAELKAELAERRMHDVELQSAQEKFRRQFDLGLIGMATATAGHRYLEVNDEMCEIIGYRRDELLQLRWDEITHPDDVAEENAKIDRVVAGEADGYSIEKRWVRKDGEIVNSIMSVNCVRREDGMIDHCVMLLQDVSERKRAEEKIAAYEGRLRSLASELVLAEERERQKIAANLHDSVSQLLTAAKSRLATLKGSVHLPNAVKQFTLINELLAEAIMDTRLLMYDLSPPVLHTLGFQATLEWFAKRVLVQHGVRVHLVDDQLPKPLDDDMLVLLFSAVRELVYNAVKHAQVGQIKVSLERDDSTIRITVCDEGVGFDIARIGSNYDVTGGFGLFSIRERLANLGGDFRISSSIGFGTTVTLIAPLKSGACMAA